MGGTLFWLYPVCSRVDSKGSLGYGVLFLEVCVKRFSWLLSAIFVLSFGMCSADIHCEKKGNVINFYSDDDVVLILPYRMDAKFMKSLPKAPPKVALTQLLRQDRLIEMIAGVWALPQQARLKWLGDHVSQHHPVVYFLYGMELIDTAQSSEEVLNGIIQFKIGSLLTLFDAKCTSDPSVGAANGALEMTLMEIVSNRLDRLSVTFEEFNEKADKQRLKVALEEALKAFLKDDKLQCLHSPAWVFNHGMAKYTGAENTVPKGKWDAVRLSEAKKMLQEWES